MPIALVQESDEERARKTVIALAQDAEAGNRKLAQWLLDNPKWSAPLVAGWIGCSNTKIKQLRGWARKGFIGAQRDGNLSRPRGDGRRDVDQTLKSNNNFEDDTFEPDENVEEPGKVLANVLDSIKQSKAVAEAYRKILKVSPFDRAAKKEIGDAIELLIRKWRSVQSTLAAKGKSNEQDT